MHGLWLRAILSAAASCFSSKDGSPSGTRAGVFLVICILPVAGYAQEPGQAPPDTVQQAAEQDEQTTDDETFLENIGFYVNAQGGFMARFNGYSTYEPLLQSQIPVDYNTKLLSVLNASGEVGLAGVRLVNYDYQRAFPNNEFQKKALAFRQDKTYGLKKYTLGIDTTPLWLLLLPEETSWLVKRILSVRFRTVRELTQTNAQVTESSLTPPTSGRISDYGDPSSYEDLSSGTSYSFKTRYRYDSISIPLLIFLNDAGHFNVGVARWEFARSYAATVPHLNKQVIFDATVSTYALAMELWLSRPDKQGIVMDIFYGYGVINNLEGSQADLNKLLFEGDGKTLDITNHNYEVNIGLGFEMFEDNDKINFVGNVGFEANTFTTAFNNFSESPDGSKDFSKIDWFILPWARFTLSYY